LRVKDIERQFLLATSYLQTEEGKSMVSLDEVAAHLGADITDIEERNVFARLAHGLGMRGFLRDVAGSKQSHWMTFSITERGLDELESRNQGSSGDTHITVHGNISSSIVGARDNAQLVNNFNFAAMQQEIDEKGGEDRQELTQLRQEIEAMLNSDKQVDRGRLARFAKVIRDNSWITSHVGAALVSFATQQVPPA
jgi:hypothetical protein